HGFPAVQTASLQDVGGRTKSGHGELWLYRSFAAPTLGCSKMLNRTAVAHGWPRRNYKDNFVLLVAARFSPDSPACPRGRRVRSGPKQREALVRVEEVGLDVVDDLGLAAECIHRPRQTDPIQEFLLAGVLYLFGREIAPAREIARGELVEAGPVARDIGVEPVMLFRQECMRPAR